MRKDAQPTTARMSPPKGTTFNVCNRSIVEPSLKQSTLLLNPNKHTHTHHNAKSINTSYLQSYFITSNVVILQLLSFTFCKHIPYCHISLTTFSNQFASIRLLIFASNLVIFVVYVKRDFGGSKICAFFQEIAEVQIERADAQSIALYSWKKKYSGYQNRFRNKRHKIAIPSSILAKSFLMGIMNDFNGDLHFPCFLVVQLSFICYISQRGSLFSHSPSNKKVIFFKKFHKKFYGKHKNCTAKKLIQSLIS